MTKFEKIKEEIDALSADILHKLNSGEWSELDVLISRRHRMMQEMLTLQDNSQLPDFLNEFQTQQHTMVQAMLDERTKIAKTLSNLKNVKAYIE